MRAASTGFQLFQNRLRLPDTAKACPEQERTRLWPAARPLVMGILAMRALLFVPVSDDGRCGR